MSTPVTGGRRTVMVTHAVDVPPGVTDERVAEVFADMYLQYPALPGWWISLPEVKDPAPVSVTDQCARCSGDCPMTNCPTCGGCENTGQQPCPDCLPQNSRCPDCGRGDCTGEDCYWGDDLDDDADALAGGWTGEDHDLSHGTGAR